MSRVCHAHCPPKAGTPVAAIVIAAVTLQLAGIVTSLLPLIFWTLVVVLVVASVGAGRTRRRPTLAANTVESTRQRHLPSAGMDPTIAAALIGVGGVVIVAVAGYWTTIRTTRMTLAAAKDGRIWESRATAYVDALAAVHYRQVRREYDTRSYRLDGDGEARAKAYLDAYKAPDWYELEARLQAFASQPVVTTTQAGAKAHMAAVTAYQAWQLAAGQTGADNEARRQGIPVPSPPGEASGNIALHKAQVEARKAADDADDALVELIREELQGHGRPLDDFGPFIQRGQHE